MSRLTIDISDEISQTLAEISKKEGITLAEAIRRALALLAVADTQKSKGNTLGIVKGTNKGDAFIYEEYWDQNDTYPN